MTEISLTHEASVSHMIKGVLHSLEVEGMPDDWSVDHICIDGHKIDKGLAFDQGNAVKAAVLIEADFIFMKAYGMAGWNISYGKTPDSLLGFELKSPAYKDVWIPKVLVLRKVFESLCARDHAGELVRDGDGAVDMSDGLKKIAFAVSQINQELFSVEDLDIVHSNNYSLEANLLRFLEHEGAEQSHDPEMQ